jgi:hypothetical protein
MKPGLSSKSTVSTILLAGGVAGALDLVLATSSMVAAAGVSPLRPWKGVAAALVGKSAVAAGGDIMALLGIVLHFLITITAAAIYVAAYQRLDLLRRHPVLSGVAFGVLFMLTMNYVILPLSALGHPLYVGLAALVREAETHTLVVGLPISLIVARRLAA